MIAEATIRARIAELEACIDELRKLLSSGSKAWLALEPGAPTEPTGIPGYGPRPHLGHGKVESAVATHVHHPDYPADGRSARQIAKRIGHKYQSVRAVLYRYPGVYEHFGDRWRLKRREERRAA